MVRTVKIALGRFACSGIETSLDSDLPNGVRAALSDFIQRIDSGRPPAAIPRFSREEGSSGGSTLAVDLPVDNHTWAVLEREAARQGATVGELATHSVLLYLAELDRLTPSNGASAA